MTNRKMRNAIRDVKSEANVGNGVKMYVNNGIWILNIISLQNPVDV